MNYLLDTNVISETFKPKYNENVKTFMDKIPLKDQYLTSISMGEISKGVEKRSVDKRKHDLYIWLYKTIPERFKGRIVSIDTEVMYIWGRICNEAGRTLPMLDSIIAAAALTYNMILVTRNVKYFEGIPGLGIINPWDYKD